MSLLAVHPVTAWDTSRNHRRPVGDAPATSYHSVVAEQPSDWSPDPSGALLRAELLRVTRRTAQLMEDIAASRERLAASYRQMAMRDGPRQRRYLEHAEELDRSAQRARRFAEYEKQQLSAWQQ